MNSATRFHPAFVLSSVLTVGAWAASLVVVVLAFSYGGSSGMFAAASHASIGAEDVTGFSISTASVSLLISLAMAAAPQFLSAGALASVFGRAVAAPKSRESGAARARHLPRLVAVIALLAAVLVALGSIVRYAWWIWLCALVLGLLLRLLLSRRSVTLKPWRLAGIGAAGLLFLAGAFQVFGGYSSGLRAVVLMSFLSAGLLAVGGLAAFVVRGPETADDSEQLTGAFPARAHDRTRNPSDIAVPWVPYVLFGVLGALLAVAQPITWELAYGQAGFALITSAILVGWAVGFESGPSIVPGMSRPRVTAIALLLAGALLILMGIVRELSGLTLFAAAAAWCVGAGTRAQDYRVTRRFGFIAGVVIALLVTALNLAVDIPLSTTVNWPISSTEAALLVIGAASAVAGIVAVLTFDPHGVRALPVDLVYAFQSPAVTRPRPKESGEVATHVPNRGIFIVLEGGDGSGKSTQATLLATRLRQEAGVPVTQTREPGGTPEGARIRRVILDGEGVSPRSEALLYAADRAHHVASVVQPALSAGGVVIADRYIDSSLAYQSAGRELDSDEIRGLSLWGTSGLLPHLTILLDIDPEQALARTESRGERDHLERQASDFHSRVREKYLAMAQADPARYLVVDANRPAETIAADLYRIVSGRALTARERGTVAAPERARLADSEAGDASGDEHDTTVIPRPESEGPAASGVAATDLGTAEDDASEASTTVLPASGGRRDLSDSVFGRDEPDDGQDAPEAEGPVSADPSEAETTTLRAKPAEDLPAEAETTAVPASGGQWPASTGPAPGTAGAPEPGPADPAPGSTGQPSRRGRSDSNRERLLAQSRVERDARERLRRARGQHPDDPGKRR